MRLKKKSKLCFLVAMVLTITLCFGATVSGATLPPSTQPAHERSNGSSVSGVDTKVTPPSFQAGEMLYWGKFNNQPLAWKILKIENNNKALLFATDILSNTWLPFDETSNVWETSSIRAWLNGTQKGEFLSESNFTQDDRRAIIQTPISTGILGNATNDNVFLISSDEYYQYDVGNVPYDINSFWSRTGVTGSGIEASKPKGRIKKQASNKDFVTTSSENVALFASYHQASGAFNASEKGGIRPLMWVDLSALPSNSAIENQAPSPKANTAKPSGNAEIQAAKPSGNVDTLSVAIQSTDNLISSMSGRSYKVYGPFDGDSIKSVTCQLNNDVDARLEMVLSGQNKTVEGVEATNCIGFGKTYTSTLMLSQDLLNVKRQFYLFVGSDHIKNLTATISFSNN